MKRKFLSIILIFIFLFAVSADVKSAKGSIGSGNSINRRTSEDPKALEYTEKMNYVKERILEFTNSGEHVVEYKGNDSVDTDYDGDVVYDIMDYMEKKEKENPDVLSKSNKARIDEYMNKMIDNMQRSGHSKEEIHNMVVEEVQNMAEEVLLGKGRPSDMPEKIERFIKTGSVSTDEPVPVTRDNSAQSEIVSTLKNNDRVIIVDEKEDSFYIQDNSGRRGFAKKIGIDVKLESAERFPQTTLSTIPFMGRMPLFEEKVLPESEIQTSLEMIDRESSGSDVFMGSAKNEELLKQRVDYYVELESIRNEFEKELKDKSITEVLASKPGIANQIRSREIQQGLKEIDTKINSEIKNNSLEMATDITEFVLKRCNKGTLPALSNIVNNAKETLVKNQGVSDHDSSGSISNGGRGGLFGAIANIIEILNKVSKVIEVVVSFLENDSMASEYFGVFLNDTAFGNESPIASLTGGSSSSSSSDLSSLTSDTGSKLSPEVMSATGGAARIVRSALGAVNRSDVIYGVDCYTATTEYGNLACAAVVSAILKNASVGFNTHIVYCPTMVNHLGSMGWTTTRSGDYAPGDVCFWTRRSGDRPRHVGVIVERDAYGAWWAVDNSSSGKKVLKRPLVRSYYPIILPGKRIRN